MIGKKEDIKQKYGLTAEFYDSRYERIQTDKYVDMLEGLKINEPILDLGCGTGLLKKVLLRNIFGCDISFEMLERAAKRGETVVQADMEFLPFKSGVFNSVLSFTSLQNLLEAKQALEEVKRVSKGICVLTMLKRRLTEDFYKHLRKIFEIQEIKDIGEDAGFILSSNK